MSEHPLDLDDADFWGEPPVARVLGSTSGGLDERLLLDGPHRVDLAERATLPMGLLRRTTTGKAVSWELSAYAHVAALHLESHWSHVARPFLPPGWMRDDHEPYVPGGGLATTVRFFDLRERLGVPWRAGTLLVTAFLGDQVTNRVRVELGGGGGAPDAGPRGAAGPRGDGGTTGDALPGGPGLAAPDLRAPGARIGARTGPWPRPAWEEDVWPPPGVPYPAYGFTPPAWPGEGIGIALEAERVVVLEEGARAVVHGAFRLPLLPRERVPAPPDDLADAERAALGRWPAAIVPVKLVVLGSRTPDATVIGLRVPVFAPPAELDGRPVVTGTFALDLLAHDDVPRRGQTLFVYALADEVLAGPALVGMITREMLP